MKYKIHFTPDETAVHLNGHVDEHIDKALGEIRPQVKTKRVVFDLTNVGVLNSIGCSVWLAHIKAFDDLTLTFVNCPYTFVSLVLLIPELTGKGVLESFFVRYYCETCDTGDHQTGLAHREESLKLGGFKPMRCGKCGTAMEAEPADRDFLELFADTQRSA